MSNELFREILGCLYLQPRLLEATNLTEADFPTGRFRQVYSEIARLWKELKPSEIDPVVLAERIGGEDAHSFIGSLLAGSISEKPSVFKGRVNEARRQALTLRIRSRLHEQDALPFYDLSVIRQDLQALDKISSVDSQSEHYLIS
jgi:hypothetical protein